MLQLLCTAHPSLALERLQELVSLKSLNWHPWIPALQSFLHYSADGTSFILLRKQKTPVVTEHTQFVKGNSGFALVCTTRVG